jgi:hypothetical protein
LLESKAPTPAETSLIGQGKISIVNMIDNLATQKKITGLKLTERKLTGPTIRLASQRDPIRQKSSRVETTASIDFKVHKGEMSGLSQDISSSFDLLQSTSLKPSTKTSRARKVGLP